ncbi:MAG: DUF1311 domain-containing protein [Deltaproteobacteria bacterium]|nr:DUF1311 domain-containing protein [Deltaproteobacteria bacterium]
MKKIYILCSILLNCIFIDCAFSASFDCKKSSTLVEKTICSDSDLSNQDDLLHSIYSKVMSESKNKSLLLQQQKDWLKKRNECHLLDCLKTLYVKRIQELKQISQFPSLEVSKKYVGLYYPGPEKVDGTPGNSILVTLRGGDDMSIDDEDIILEIKSGSENEKKIASVCFMSDKCEIVGLVKNRQLESLISVRNLLHKK